MKKLIFALIVLISFTLSTAAQQTPKKPAAPKKEVKAPKKEVKAPIVKNEAPKPPFKKDGTPDKRFKVNKAPKAPLKKDGTPDKRFKKNKN